MINNSILLVQQTDIYTRLIDINKRKGNLFITMKSDLFS